MKDYGIFENNSKYIQASYREYPIYTRDFDIRSDFSRDYTRILFSDAYKRLKHKTQVFFSPNNDHICTRIEHVNLVESVSTSIATYLGLNVELTRAIAVGHDLGHAPFGHGGEKILSKLSEESGCKQFWHEKNSLYIVDYLETLSDLNGDARNLNLCYAVRDGIICHCGEAYENHIKPREEVIDLLLIKYPGEYSPYTWEGCVVKISDKIAYLGRDIEDGLRLGIINNSQVDSLLQQINNECFIPFTSLTNGSLLNYFIKDVCENSSYEDGISMSQNCLNMMNAIMKFNYQYIYLNDRLQVYAEYVDLILRNLHKVLKNHSQGYDDCLLQSLSDNEYKAKLLICHFIEWLKKYGKFTKVNNQAKHNTLIYDFTLNADDIDQAIIDFLSCMSDQFMIRCFNEVISF